MYCVHNVNSYTDFLNALIETVVSELWRWSLLTSLPWLPFRDDLIWRYETIAIATQTNDVALASSRLITNIFEL